MLSVHLASALSQTPPDSSIYKIDDPETLRFFTEQPMVWFGFSPESPVHIIPGFQDSAFEDAARTFFVGGQVGDPPALFHEFQLYCNVPLADVSGVQAPVFIYHLDWFLKLGCQVQLGNAGKQSSTDCISF